MNVVTWASTGNACRGTIMAVLTRYNIIVWACIIRYNTWSRGPRTATRRSFFGDDSVWIRHATVTTMTPSDGDETRVEITMTRTAPNAKPPCALHAHTRRCRRRRRRRRRGSRRIRAVACLLTLAPSTPTNRPLIIQSYFYYPEWQMVI